MNFSLGDTIHVRCGDTEFKGFVLHDSTDGMMTELDSIILATGNGAVRWLFRLIVPNKIYAPERKFVSELLIMETSRNVIIEKISICKEYHYNFINCDGEWVCRDVSQCDRNNPTWERIEGIRTFDGEVKPSIRVLLNQA